MTRKSESGYSRHTNLKYEKRIIPKKCVIWNMKRGSFIFLGANMKYEAWISNFKKNMKFEILYPLLLCLIYFILLIVTLYFLYVDPERLYMCRHHLTTYRQLTKVGMFEGTGARYREEWAARALIVVVLISKTSYY